MKIQQISEALLGRTPSILGHEQFMKFAVLLPLVEVNNEVHILFEVRALTLRRQPGEVCFPGGRIEKGEEPRVAAARETSEELGIKESEITNMIPLDFMVSAFGTIIYPFVGTINNPESIKPSEAEVGEVFTVPLAFFKKNQPATYKINFQVEPEDGFPFDLIIGGENYNWQTRSMDEYFYRVNGKVIWGLTARVLTHFLELMEQENIRD
ncbi:CoA pyrophosphatase [Mesobacillus sp. AQ2]|jgi:peroxisomal coenzyme A diphosphatase NUDT7|uniref:NUDIX hydrolase n=1 Tax=unclassified Mesobacillus TaxID=2675270 RepID=UPI00203A7BD4|nr:MULTISPECIES: CoA pyrophosphatase [unclassified Mesobacillus]MCM3121709.1 CoA pyrophosphatase [Mesobacillus sp. MER 33]MCM3231673.1 CoA pyrophosphatase [Mesobacillus sp. MER 48]WHX38641.1 CoA pyrophosphatase [Mesobacillus sp. AQ2]